MATDLAAILRLPALVDHATAAARAVHRQLALPSVEPLTLAFLGAVDVGKTAIVRSLLGDAGASVTALKERIGPDTLVPVEYVHSTRLQVAVRSRAVAGGGARWTAIAPDNSRAATRAGVTRIRVAAPAPVLEEWGVRFVDYPSVEGGDGLSAELAAELSRPGTGVIYILSQRGATDADIDVLEQLRHLPVVVVQNLRENQLRPDESLIEIRPAASSACPFTVPLVPFRTDGSARMPGAAETEQLRLCAALLGTAARPSAEIAAIRRAVGAATAAVRGDVAGRFEAVLAAARGTDPQAHLAAALELFALTDECAGLMPLDDTLDELASVLAPASLPRPGQIREALRDRSRRLADAYNIEAGQWTAPTAPGPTTPRPVINFGAQYVHARESLIKTLHAVLQAAQTMELQDSECKRLEELARQVADDRIEIALLGQFSSGKSSLINALLGLPVDDNDSKLLPTASGTETATVNRVEYDEHTRLLRVSWLEWTDLTFLTASGGPGRFRVHVDEIKALRNWLASGEVAADDCRFDITRPERWGRLATLGRSREPDPSAAFEALYTGLGFPASEPTHAYWNVKGKYPALPDQPLPIGVTVRAFRAPPDVALPGDTGAEHPQDARPRPEPTRKELFEQLRRMFGVVKTNPAVALRVGEMVVGYDHPLLKYATFIDTPGTDAPVPHHRTVARAIVRGKFCPVVYCIPAVKPFGKEDSDNLGALLDWGIGSTNAARFFFVITKKSKVTPEELAQVRALVAAQIARLDIPAPIVRAIDVKVQDPEFDQLKTDIAAFVQGDRKERYLSWINSGRLVVLEAHRKLDERVSAGERGENERRQRVAHLMREADELAKILAEFRDSASWGAKWAPASVQAIRRQTESVRSTIEQLDNRQAFTDLHERLAEEIDWLNEDASARVRAVGDGMVGKLGSVLAQRLPGRTLDTAIPPGDAPFFPSAEVLEVVQQIEWRGVIKRFFAMFGGAEWNQDVATNRNRIRQAWNRAEGAGLHSAEVQLYRTVDVLRRRLEDLGDDIQKDIRANSNPPSPAEAAALRQRRERAWAWVRRFEALARNFQRGTA